MSEHPFEDELEERDDVVDRRDNEREGEPWAKASGGDVGRATNEDEDD